MRMRSAGIRITAMRAALYVDGTAVATLPEMVIQPGAFALAGGGVSVGRNAGQEVSSAYRAPFPFTVVAVNYGAYTRAYQWRLNGNNISGATGTSYTVNNAQQNAAVISARLSGSTQCSSAAGVQYSIASFGPSVQARAASPRPRPLRW